MASQKSVNGRELSHTLWIIFTLWSVMERVAIVTCTFTFPPHVDQMTCDSVTKLYAEGKEAEMKWYNLCIFT